jgi:hypothetical protein
VSAQRFLVLVMASINHVGFFFLVALLSHHLGRAHPVGRLGSGHPRFWPPRTCTRKFSTFGCPFIALYTCLSPRCGLIPCRSRRACQTYCRTCSGRCNSCRRSRAHLHCQFLACIESKSV